MASAHHNRMMQISNCLSNCHLECHEFSFCFEDFSANKNTLLLDLRRKIYVNLFPLLFIPIAWASELGSSQEVPKSTSETVAEVDDVPPPLPTKHRTSHHESATLPRSSRVVGTGSKSPTETSSHVEDSTNVDKPVALPRLKTISSGHSTTNQVCRILL